RPSPDQTLALRVIGILYASVFTACSSCYVPQPDANRTSIYWPRVDPLPLECPLDGDVPLDTPHTDYKTDSFLEMALSFQVGSPEA
ncbi:unnamed protein product, partial [Tenebrio molitor]